ncbi:MAG TPA: adenylate/guanylate cyclase domain-containing protein, partial [Fibrobacteria bacterium]|nr:adenylate/guanylate cyclase domain-containing protein [Fibrobacteria bacterium]
MQFVRLLTTSFAKLLGQAEELWRRRTPPIAYQLAFWFTLVITIGMGVLGSLVVQQQTRFLRTQMAEFGYTIARQMAESTKEQILADDLLGLRASLTNLVGKENVLGAAIYAHDGTPMVAVGYLPDDVPAIDLARTHDAHEWAGPNDADGQPLALSSYATPVVFQDVVAGYALLTLDSTPLESARVHTFRMVMGATFVVWLIGIVSSFALSKLLTKPIDQLMDASRAIAAGNYQVRFDDRRNDELGALMQSMNHMSEGLLRKEQVEKTFSRYVSPNVAREVLAHMETVELGGRRVEATVLFADIAGFTALSETMHPEEVSALLNEYFGFIAQAAHAFHGHVDKYIGDCAMLLFGVPVEDEDHAFHAIACAVVIQRAIQALNQRREADGLVPVHFRIGINTGAMLAGNMGSPERMEYTVVGDAVNLASRLASVG